MSRVLRGPKGTSGVAAVCAIMASIHESLMRLLSNSCSTLSDSPPLIRQPRLSRTLSGESADEGRPRAIQGGNDLSTICDPRRRWRRCRSSNGMCSRRESPCRGKLWTGRRSGRRLPCFGFGGAGAVCSARRRTWVVVGGPLREGRWGGRGGGWTPSRPTARTGQGSSR